MARELLPSLDAHFESLFAIEPVDAFRVHLPTLAPEKNRQPAIAIAWTRQGELSKTHPKRCLVWGLALVSMGTPGPAGDAHRVSLTHTQLRLKGVNLPTPLGWPQSFFRSTSWRICLSSVRSATKLFSRRFSSSSCFSFLISLGAISPNFFFHR